MFYNTQKKAQLLFLMIFFEKNSLKLLPVQKLVVPLQSEINKWFLFLTPWLSW